MADLLSMTRSGFRWAGIAIAVAGAVALAGCGNADNNPVSNGNRMVAEARLTTIDMNMTTALTADPGSLPQLTQEFITAAQGSQALLGADLTKQKLMATATRLAPYCASCTQSLNTAAAQVGQ